MLQIPALFIGRLTLTNIADDYDCFRWPTSNLNYYKYVAEERF